MPITAHHRRLTAWIAIVAMLALALVPTISRAMAYASGGSAWAEVCTPQGMQRVFADGERMGTPPDGMPQIDPCHFCPLAAAGAAPLPMAAPALALPPAGAELPSLFPQAARTLHAWRSAQPRGPPFLA